MTPAKDPLCSQARIPVQLATEEHMIDAYLQIEGIKGESQDHGHAGWIEVNNVSFGVNQPRATSVSTAGGHTTGTADLAEVSFSKLADIASPVLFQHCAMGKTLPKAKLEFMRADGDGKPIKYYQVELENVMISNVSPSSGNGGLLTEQIHLSYSKIKLTYSQQKIGGGACGNSSGGWCAASKKPV
jgi:type VI secretion system secreted protein Hcp